MPNKNKGVLLLVDAKGIETECYICEKSDAENTVVDTSNDEARKKSTFRSFGTSKNRME